MILVVLLEAILQTENCLCQCGQFEKCNAYLCRYLLSPNVCFLFFPHWVSWKSQINARLYAGGGPWVLIADGTKVLPASFVPDCPIA
jgi:hypothetical protein